MALRTRCDNRSLNRGGDAADSDALSPRMTGMQEPECACRIAKAAPPSATETTESVADMETREAYDEGLSGQQIRDNPNAQSGSSPPIRHQRVKRLGGLRYVMPPYRPRKISLQEVEDRARDAGFESEAEHVAWRKSQNIWTPPCRRPR